MCKNTKKQLVYQADHETGEILRDGNRDWQKYKAQSLAVADSFRQCLFIDSLRYSNRMRDCAAVLKFKTCPHGHEKRLEWASFCGGRFCPICQRRKSLVMFHQVKTLIHCHLTKYKSDRPLLLTLTIPNVKANDLPKAIDSMQKGFKKLTMRRQFKKSIRSYFRALEVTFNENRDDYHPHFHVLLMVPESYFKRDRGLYISQEEWLSMWQESMQMPEITQVDIRRVRKKGKKKPIEAVTAEVAKYATKPSNYLKRLPTGKYSANPEVLESLYWALKSRRLTGFGGYFYHLRKELRLKDVEDADLVHIKDDSHSCTCSVCSSTLVSEMYTWNIGLSEYVG